MSYNIGSLDEKTSENLEAIFNFAHNKWIEGGMKTEPTKLEIVRSLINGLYDGLVEEGDIVE